MPGIITAVNRTADISARTTYILLQVLVYFRQTLTMKKHLQTTRFTPQRQEPYMTVLQRPILRWDRLDRNLLS